MKTQYRMQLPGSVYAGQDALGQLEGIARNYHQVVLLSDESIKKTGLLEKPAALLAQSGVPYKIMTNLPTEPTVDQVQQVSDEFRPIGADLIVAIGGGSVLDMAKLLSVLDTDDYTARDLLADPGRARKTIHSVIIPTTAGTGSEATPNAIVNVPEQELKVGIVNGAMMADYVILDAVFTEKLPKSIAAATGVDALCHCIECYTGNKANPFSDLFALQGIKLIFEHIEKACLTGNAEARQQMLLAAFYGGIAISAAGTTAVHALAYPLGGKYHIAHGVSNAMLLVPVMHFNEDAIRPRLAEIYDAAGDGTAETERDKAAWVVKRLGEIVRDLDIPTSLGKYNVPKEDLETLVENGMKVTRLLDNNVKKVTAADARKIYSQIL